MKDFPEATQENIFSENLLKNELSTYSLKIKNTAVKVRFSKDDNAPTLEDVLVKIAVDQTR